MISIKDRIPKAEKKKAPEMPSARQRFEQALAILLQEYALSPAVIAEARRLARTLE
jgi:hypothetical protein